MNYRIGCSGFYYHAWKNKFYPEGMPASGWLPHYSTIFNTVELNSTFYRIPKLATLRNYVNATPGDFRFSVKTNKLITHFHKLNESGEMIRDFQDLIQEGLREKLSCLLFQLPPSFHYSSENLERILNNVPNEERNVIEFRHPSWWNQTVKTAFENAQLTFCNIDYPDMDVPFVHTTSSFYLRLHGNPELFKSSYSLDRLRELCDQFPPQCKTFNIYFNNTQDGAGYTNAGQLMSIVNNSVPGTGVVR